MSATVQVLINPTSGRGAAERVWERLRPVVLARFDQVTVTVGRGPGDLEATAARVAATGGTKLLIVLGGDGTVHEVVNGLVTDRGSVDPDLALVLVPAGSGNDLARTFGFPTPVAARFGALLDAPPVPFDVGRLEYHTATGGTGVRFFANCVSWGLSGQVIETLGAHRRLGGRLGYLVATIQTLLRGNPQEVTVTREGAAPFRGPVLLLTICNGPTFGAGIPITPAATTGDGRLDQLLVPAMPLFSSLRALAAAYRGRHLGRWNIEYARITTTWVDTPEPVTVELDGEHLRGSGPFRVTVLPGALRVCRLKA